MSDSTGDQNPETNQPMPGRSAGASIVARPVVAETDASLALLSGRLTWPGVIVEAAIVFAIGFLAMSFFYHHPDNPDGPDRGLPGNDSFYHVKMAKLMPEMGVVKTLPWLQYAYFTQRGDDFVSHHFGFHVLLIPFLKAGEWLIGDDLVGARWANCAFFGLVLLMYYQVLRALGVPYRGLWIILFLLMPIQFYTRHSFIRAISPSLFFMLTILWSMIRGRWLVAGLATALYNHLYLGAVMYSPVIVAAFALSSLIGRKGDRRFPWAIVIATAAGWWAGVLTYPYRDGMIEFLRLQVFGSGLTPDIEVGNEWKPYTNIWWFAVQFAGVNFAIWSLALVTRLRLGPRMTPGELTLVLMNFAFLLLTLKARRFIEYWPAFCMLSAAALSRPALTAMRTWIEERLLCVENRSSDIRRAFFASIGIGVIAWIIYALSRAAVDPNLSSDPLMKRLIGAVAVLIDSWRFWTVFFLGLALPVVVGLFRDRRESEIYTARAGWMTPWTVAVMMIGGVAGAIMWTEVQYSNSTKHGYKVADVRPMMEALIADSDPGDVVFTSDWDDFPVYFYYNSHNYYIVGLDPKFTHDRRPDLWERFVRITRGEVPRTVEKEMKDAGGNEYVEKLDIRVEDIRDRFNAKYVISDRDHRSLSNKVAAAPGFAQLIYPPGGWEKNRNAPYVVFRINAPESSQPAAPDSPTAESPAMDASDALPDSATVE